MTPPKLARKLLELVVPERDRPFVVRDLEEEFEVMLEDGASRRTARRWYWAQVLRSVWPGVSRGRASTALRVRVELAAREMRLALRTLLRRPVFHALAVGTLALGIGATAAMFAIVNGVLLEPLPYEDPDELVAVWHSAPGWGMDRLNQTVGTYLLYEEEGRFFSSIGLWDDGSVSVTGEGDPEQVTAVGVSTGMLDVLGARPALGRFFFEADGAVDAELVVVLDHGYWVRRFAGDPGVIGTSLEVSGERATVVGVTRPGFRFLETDAEILVPFRFDRSAITDISGFSYQSVARLRDGVSPEDANADVERMIAELPERLPDGIGAAELREMGFGANVRPLRQDIVGEAATTLWTLFGAVTVLLLVAAANVSNLFVVRAEDRQGDLAVRAALGAGRGQIARQLLMEGSLVGLAGGAVGLALATVAVRAVVRIAPVGLPRLAEIGVGAPVWMFTLGLSLAAGALLTLLPLIRFRRSDGGALSEVSSRTASRRTRRATDALVVVQLTMALVLLVGAGLMARSARALLAVDPGIDRPEQLLTFRVSIPSASVPDVERAALMHQRMLERVSAVPGVRASAYSSSVTLDGWDDNNTIYVEDAPPAPGALPPARQVKFVSGGYFEAMGIPILAGRPLGWPDVRERARAAAVTANFARRYWTDPTQAVGRLIATDPAGPWYEIVGVVGDVHDDGVHREPTPVVYFPAVWTDASGNTSIRRSVGFVVRSRRVGTAGLMDELRRAVWSVDPDLPLSRIATLERLLARSTERTTLVLWLLGTAAAVAVLLGLVGVYGVISFLVAKRTREIGLRMALGATTSAVQRSIIRRGITLGLFGVALGVGASLLSARFIESLLFGVRPVDPLTYLTVATALVGVTLLASWLPARRATHIDPARALRWE